ncbi:MAG TPA: nuclear transport factor 2 family protein [Blastocatellia bacterium]|nr:nuclear transport factor 2 family protein [Blastocatellia bacterium]
MTRIFLAAVTLVAASSLVFGQTASKEAMGNGGDGGDEQAVRQVLDEFSAAIKRGDTEALDRLWASDYVFIPPSGVVVTKARRLAVLRSSDTKIDSVSRDEVNIRLYEHTAVVISRTTGKGRVAGQDIDNQFRVTTVLVKRNGRWQMVAEQSNLIPKQ